MIGDVWLVRYEGGDGWRAWWRRLVTRVITLIKHGRHTGYGHVGVEAADGRILEASLAGVHYSHPKHWMAETMSGAVIRRELDESAQVLIDGAIRRYFGMKYAYLHLFGHLLGRAIAGLLGRLNPGNVICSELAAQVHFCADHYFFHKRHSDETLYPEEVRPRDIEWTARMRFSPWKCVDAWSKGRRFDPFLWETGQRR